MAESMVHLWADYSAACLVCRWVAQWAENSVDPTVDVTAAKTALMKVVPKAEWLVELTAESMVE